ncbi:hypothetical protein I4U23_002218 [Adineta vaga]|nr:hypothetical protein I4U23_002218 [Adineta vaga]
MEAFEQNDDNLMILPPDIRKVPKSLEEIVRITKFSKSEIRLLYKGFKQECPSGAVTEPEFQAIYSHFFPHGNCQNYTRFLFRALDRRKRMYFTFEDYIQTLSVLVRGSIKERLHWIFCLYDIYDDGVLTKQTFATILRSIYDLLGPNMFIHQPITDETIEKHSALIFDKLDLHHSGTIDLDDFENYCLRNEQLIETIDSLSSNLV